MKMPAAPWISIETIVRATLALSMVCVTMAACTNRFASHVVSASSPSTSNSAKKAVPGSVTAQPSSRRIARRLARARVPVQNEATERSGYVGLRTPLSHDEAIPIVRRFLRSVFSGRAKRLERLLTANAQAYPYRNEQPKRALLAWLGRMRDGSLDSFGRVPPIDDLSIKCFDAATLPSDAKFLGSPSEQEVFVRVRVTQTHAQHKRVLPDWLWFVLVPRDHSLRIERIYERIEH